MGLSNILVIIIGLTLIVVPSVVWLWRSIKATPISQDVLLVGACMLSIDFGILLLILQAAPELMERENLSSLVCMVGAFAAIVPLGMAGLLLRQWTGRLLWKHWLSKYESRYPGLFDQYKRINSIEDRKSDGEITHPSGQQEN